MSLLDRRHRPKAAGSPAASRRFQLRQSWLGAGVVLSAIVVSLAACARGPAPPATVPTPAAGGWVVRVGAGQAEGASVQLWPLESYVAGCVVAELGGSVQGPSARALRELQAVLCRTFAASSFGRHNSEGFDLCSTTHCQLFRPVDRSAPSDRDAIAAVEATAGLVLSFGGRPVHALYHADCGGHTSAAVDVWGGRAKPYLVARPDQTCATLRTWTLTLSDGDVRVALAVGAQRDPGLPLRTVEVSRRDDGGRALELRIVGTRAVVIRAEALRAAMARVPGAASLPGTRFHVDRIDGGFRFTGTGSGHGAGLCLAGAASRLAAGASVLEVLQYYFPGTALERYSYGGIAQDRPRRPDIRASACDRMGLR